MKRFFRFLFGLAWLCAVSSHATNSVPASLPSQYSELELRSLAGSKARFALINDQTMAAGERAKVRLGNGRVAVECVEIGGQSVMVRVGDDRQLRELQLRPSNVIRPVDLAVPLESERVTGLRVLAGPRGHAGCIGIINNRTFAVGEKAEMRVKGKVVTVECLAIRSNSVVVRVDGEVRQLTCTTFIPGRD